MKRFATYISPPDTWPARCHCTIYQDSEGTVYQAHRYRSQANKLMDNYGIAKLPSYTVESIIAFYEKEKWLKCTDCYVDESGNLVNVEVVQRACSCTSRTLFLSGCKCGGK